MQTFWDNVLRVIAVIGLIAVLLLGAWGIIQLAFLLPSFFSGLGGSLAGKPAVVHESVTVATPAAVVAGQPFNVTWKHMGGSGEYSYALSYSCATGLSLAAPVPTSQYQAVPCNTQFNYVSASSTMPLVAALANGTKQAQVTINVAAIKLSTKATTATGTATTNIGAPAVATTPTRTTTTSKPTSTKSTGTTYYPSGRTQNLYGQPDLAVRITSAQSTSGNTVVQFVVENIGTNVVGAGWTLQAMLPIQGSYTYPAGPQQALYPGDKITYTLRYSEDNSVTPATGYGNPCSGWSFPCQAPTPVYGGPGTCNAYGPCNVGGYAAIPYGAYSQYNPNYTYSYSGGWFFGGEHTVTIQVDPYNQVYELTKANNYASQTYVSY